MEAEPTPLAPVRTSLLSLADYVEGAQLRIPRPETARVERTRDEVVWAIREYLVPRLDDPHAPAVAVVAGPGGTGKSAILNAIARRHVSESGVMRPTTVEPIVWGPRSRSEQAWTQFLHRLREHTGADLDVVIGDDPLTEHVIFVDTPPVDVARSDGRIPALEALGLADICIFVTSASRYADAAGWMYLEAARRRGVPILHVINRLPSDPDAADELLIDYVARLHGRELLVEPDPSLVFPVVEGEIDAATGGPPGGSVGALRGELAELGHTDFRSAIINQTVLATTHAVAQRSRRVGAALAVELQERAELDGSVVHAYDAQRRTLTSDLEGGDFAELAEADIWGLAAADLTGIVTRRAGVAAQETALSWDERSGGRELLAAGGEGLRRHGQDTAYEAQSLLEQWYEELGDRAAAASSRGKLWSWTRKRVLRALWPAILDPDRPASRSLTRRYGTGAGDLVGEGRGLLAGALARCLDGDAARFERFLGPAPDAEVLREIETRAEWIEALVEDEVELVPIRLAVDDSGSIEPDQSVDTDDTDEPGPGGEVDGAVGPDVGDGADGSDEPDEAGPGGEVDGAVDPDASDEADETDEADLTQDEGEEPADGGDDLRPGTPESDEAVSEERSEAANPPNDRPSDGVPDDA